MLSKGDLPSLSRALVPLAPDHRETHPHRPIQRVATFLTQLIATARDVPQTRARRRADASEVIAAYRATVEKIRALNAKSE
jgi:hypothetical protein